MSRKAQREQERENAKAAHKEKAELKATLNLATKRKRDDVEQDDIKLKEFLEVMQPANKAKKWVAEEIDDSAAEPPTKMQAIEIPEGESDGEYEAVPKKTRQKTPPKVAVLPIATVAALPIVDQTNLNEAIPDTDMPDATDDDWLRSRTNRLLDLMEPEDIHVTSSAPGPTETPAVETFAEEPLVFNEENETMEDAPEDEEEKTDPTLEAIRSNGRLFVRNLPYTATEEDLRNHFAPFGALEEVIIPFLLLCFFPSCYMMNIQIGTAYASHMMRTGRLILVDASYFLIQHLSALTIVVLLLRRINANTILSGPSSSRSCRNKQRFCPCTVQRPKCSCRGFPQP